MPVSRGSLGLEFHLCSSVFICGSLFLSDHERPRVMSRRVALLCLFLLTASLWAVPEPGTDEVEAARARFERWRKHPAQLSRLRQDWQSYLALPPERQARIQQFDHDLHEQPASVQARLWNVFERYTD